MTEEAIAEPGERSARSGPGPGESVRTPPLRPGGYDPADYASSVLRCAHETGVSPVLLMAVLYNEAYKPHHPLLERLWQWWKPDASFGLANMHRATFERVRRTHSVAGRWTDLRDDPAFAVRTAALYLKDLDGRLPDRYPRRYTRDELLALGYNTGERNMRAFAHGVPPGPMARSYLRRLRANWQRAAEALRDADPATPPAGR
ncbi:transglycosylase SLT domain-containing protein [Streptomyces sp. NPDC086787]|uniref:transglycosylase SLT domain-containing protein n=1 Tax=Streptomyces sp. NPDC086787 TaxID=3365759 RepID=UPI0037F73AC9